MWATINHVDLPLSRYQRTTPRAPPWSMHTSESLLRTKRSDRHGAVKQACNTSFPVYMWLDYGGSLPDEVCLPFLLISQSALLTTNNQQQPHLFSNPFVSRNLIHHHRHIQLVCTGPLSLFASRTAPKSASTAACCSAHAPLAEAEPSTRVPIFSFLCSSLLSEERKQPPLWALVQ